MLQQNGMHTTHRKNVNKIEMVQRSSARYVSGDYNQTSSVTAMLTKLQWSSLASRRLQNRLIMLYRICFNLVDIYWRFNLVDFYWQQYLCKSTSSTRGHGTRFSLPKCTNQDLVYSESFFPRTVKDCME